MSRPMASVPSKNSVDPPSCQKGGLRNAALLVSWGRCGASQGANNASSSSAATVPMPITAPRLAENDIQNSRSGPGGAFATVSGTTADPAGVVIF